MFRTFAVWLPIVLVLAGCRALTKEPSETQFDVTADIRQYSDAKHQGDQYFDGVCEAILKAGAGQFMISPGDVDPPEAIYQTLRRHMGAAYTWYPVVGNHGAETAADMEWLRAWGSNAIPGLVRRGPAGSETTTFSFDRGPVHFVVLNQYFNGTSDFRAK